MSMTMATRTSTTRAVVRSPLRVVNRSTASNRTSSSKKASAPANSLSQFYGPDRSKVFGPYSDNVVPSHLTGEFPGDYGWDWVGLCADPERFAFLRQAEVMNGRWALLGALGCLLPEFLVRNNGANIYGGGVWFKTNAAALTPEGASRFAWASAWATTCPSCS